LKSIVAREGKKTLWNQLDQIERKFTVKKKLSGIYFNKVCTLTPVNKAKLF
jgi:hypothetical protein